MQSVVSPRDLNWFYNCLERNNRNQDSECSRKSQHHSEGILLSIQLGVAVISLPADLILVKFYKKPAHCFLLVQKAPHAKKQKDTQNQQVEVNVDQ